MKLSATSELGRRYLPLITDREGELRRSKPKDGVAAYIWRMVGFAVSSDSRLQCMPVTADFGIDHSTVPSDWHPDIPADYLAARVAKTNERPSDVSYCVKEAGSVAEYHRRRWHRYDRRKQWIKTVLDPVVEEIVRSVPLRQQAGTMRWGRAFGLVA